MRLLLVHVPYFDYWGHGWRRATLHGEDSGWDILKVPSVALHKAPLGHFSLATSKVSDSKRLGNWTELEYECDSGWHGRSQVASQHGFSVLTCVLPSFLRTLGPQQGAYIPLHGGFARQPPPPLSLVRGPLFGYSPSPAPSLFLSSKHPVQCGQWFLKHSSNQMLPFQNLLNRWRALWFDIQGSSKHHPPRYPLPALSCTSSGMQPNEAAPVCLYRPWTFPASQTLLISSFLLHWPTFCLSTLSPSCALSVPLSKIPGLLSLEIPQVLSWQRVSYFISCGTNTFICTNPS